MASKQWVEAATTSGQVVLEVNGRSVCLKVGDDPVPLTDDVRSSEDFKNLLARQRVRVLNRWQFAMFRAKQQLHALRHRKWPTIKFPKLVTRCPWSKSLTRCLYAFQLYRAGMTPKQAWYAARFRDRALKDYISRCLAPRASRCDFLGSAGRQRHEEFRKQMRSQ